VPRHYQRCARNLLGSDKREPFSPDPKTVLVFGNAPSSSYFFRCSRAIAFSHHEKTKKEVSARSSKSKNYRNVSGYVELEFTESVVGFWGMRFD